MHKHPPLPRLRVSTGLALLAPAFLLFGWLSIDLLHQGPVMQSDAPISNWFHAHTSAQLTELLLAVSYMHSTLGICLMALAAAALLAWCRLGQWLPPLLLAVPGGLLLNAGVKQAFQRGRPVFADPLLTIPTYSFPSGHTAGATVWWGFLLVLLFAHHPPLRWRVMATLLAVAMVALTALSRVYLGAHYLSDVVAAIAEGAAWLTLCFMATGVLHRPFTPLPVERHG